jgi:hypothetical protein
LIHIKANCRRQGQTDPPNLVKDRKMKSTDTVIAIFPDHNAAEAAIKNLTEAGFAMKNLSIVGKGYHTEETVVGFYNIGDRVSSGARGARSGAVFGACSSADCS